MPASREPDRWNEVGQDTWPPSLDERLYDADMVPGADDGESARDVPRPVEELKDAA